MEPTWSMSIRKTTWSPSSAGSTTARRTALPSGSSQPSSRSRLSFIFCELEKSLPFLKRRWELYHWRYAPRKIDIIAQAPRRTLALFEMKASTTVGADDFRHLDWFFTEGPGKSYKGLAFVISLGDQMFSFGSGS